MTELHPGLLYCPKDIAASNLARNAEKSRPEWGAAPDDRTFIRCKKILTPPATHSGNLCKIVGPSCPCTCTSCFSNNIYHDINHSRDVVWKFCRKEIIRYCRQMALLNIFYMRNEREVKYINHQPTADSRVTLLEIEQDFQRLDVPSNINTIFNKYKNSITCSTCKDLLKAICKVWLRQALKFFDDVMDAIYNDIRADVILECKIKCEAIPAVYNLIDKNAIRYKDRKLLNKGLNFIPKARPNLQEFVQEIVNCLKRCLLGAYHGATGEKVRINRKNVNAKLFSVTEILALIQMQPKCNPKINKCVMELVEQFMSRKNKYLSNLYVHRAFTNKSNLKVNVKGGFIALADKGIAVVALPHSWYSLQFAKLIENPAYSLLNLRQSDCISMLLDKINNFKLSLTVKEKALFRDYFNESNNNYNIAAIRLLPKVHKLDSEPCLTNFHQIPSRIVRGGESCPLNSYSKCLKDLLSETMNDLRNYYKQITKSNHKFPLITGCEQYFEHINDVTLDGKSFFKTLLVTSDFKDAFTYATLVQLIDAIQRAGTWLKYDPVKIKVMIKLARLVIPLCTFNIPQGIVISNDGYPIGGHSSCECLNLNLLVCELKTLSQLVPADDVLRSVCRLVDDVSYIFQGNFTCIMNTLNKFVHQYPPMELNVQMSPRLSCFLDYKIYNPFYTANKLTTVMARKPLNTYQYVRPDSNCPVGHKACVVDSTLHRVFRRCNNKTDRIIQIMYTRCLMYSRGYPDRVFNAKFNKFILKRKLNASGTSKKKKPINKFTKTIRARIPFDETTKSHNFFKFVNRVGKKFDLGPPIIVPKPKVNGKIASKRQIISKLSKVMGYNTNLSTNSHECPKNCKLCLYE